MHFYVAANASKGIFDSAGGAANQGPAEILE
jgi:hypothetical protein